MPVINQVVTITYKVLPLTLYADGTASVTVRRGLLFDDGKWEEIGQKTIVIDNPVTVGEILDVEPVAGLSRRDDLSLAVYNYLVSIGEVSGSVQ